jgi:hypothetical protein
MGTDRYEGEAASTPDQRAHRICDENLPAICSVAHSRSHGYRKPDDVTVVRRDLASVEPDPRTDVTGLVRLAVVEQHSFLDALTGNHGIYRGIEDGKSTVTEVLDESAAGGGQGITDDPVMVDADLIGDIIAKPVTQTRRTDKIREHQCG